MDPSGTGQDQGPSDVGGGFGQDIRGIGDPYASLFCLGDVDVIEADREVRDTFEVLRGLKDLSGDGVCQRGQKGVIGHYLGHELGFGPMGFVPSDLEFIFEFLNSNKGDLIGNEDLELQGLAVKFLGSRSPWVFPSPWD